MKAAPKMKYLEIKWKHFDKDGKICNRCFNTGQNIQRVIAKLKSECLPAKVRVKFREVKLPVEKLGESNTILFNGIPIERMISKITLYETTCGSCSALAGKLSSCRALQYQKETYDTVPEDFIYEVSCKILGCCG
ncbi:DUF2703 domain-containing protein [Candidatus Parcubacteria bacterium]|nr:DUF2703 domain-containing protein [Patescibacteria group bacterium]MBU4467019.1 DUF2703 domain-containing protein [Patescibacteria group bacterium]MCG2688190.1 DUF2703 domain-containing protein [Candidatus Parcubacteria bacterium]